MHGDGGEQDVIRLRGLEKRFGRRRALAGVDLTLGGQQIVGIVGPDGAGKTTLIRALAGLLEIEAAEAEVLGYDLRADVSELKAHIGYMPQAFSLHRDLSVIENLRFTARLHRLETSAFTRLAEELLKRTQLAPFADRSAGALSGGMKQKLAIANALLVRPDLLLLDEPTAGVDVMARTEIWDLLQRVRRRTLVLLSTGYLDEAAACDRLVYLDHGRVVATGTPAELRESVRLDAYRAWGDNPRAIAREARRFPYVAGARPTGRYARIDVGRPAPAPEQVMRDLVSLPHTKVRFAEPIPVDMESTLLALARRAGRQTAAQLVPTAQ